MKAGARTNNPAHPGWFEKMEIIEAFGLTVTDGPKAVGVTRPALSAELNERAHLSPEMALRLEKAFGMSLDILMGMQSSFDVARIRKREAYICVFPFKGKTDKGQSVML